MRLFADRIFIIINGFEVAEVETCDYSVVKNFTPAETMTRNKKSLGFFQGNLAITLNLTLFVDNKVPQINLALVSEEDDVTIGYEQGGDSHLFTDVVQNELSGQGSVGKSTKTLALLALDHTDENGRSRLEDLNL